MRYIGIPNEINFNIVKNNQYSFSPLQYKTFLMKNKNYCYVRDFLSRKLTRRDLGTEVGSLCYIEKSPNYFMRTKALQEHYYIPQITKESALPILPKMFTQMSLKKGDFLISKDSNIGEAVILDKDYDSYMLSGALYRLPVKKWKYYLFSMVKHKVFREQLDCMVAKGATIRHAKTKFLDVKIPLPNSNQENVIKYIEILTESVINKEAEIHRKHVLIHNFVDKELKQNQKQNEFEFDYPWLSEVKASGRLDTSLYIEGFKKKNFLVTNYIHGHKNLIERGFTWRRGTSLEKNFIKTRINSDIYIEGFYELIIPTNISIYGTIERTSYIGTPTKLKTIKKGDIIFGGEGFEKGRSFVVCDDVQNIATNYHGIRIINTNNNLTESIFIRCFLSYWRSLGMIDYIGVGGSGGHCAPAYFDMIETPLFLESKQKEIANLYHNTKAEIDTNRLTLKNFLDEDSAFNEKAGITELDHSAKKIKARLDEVIDLIVNDLEIKIEFDFLKKQIPTRSNKNHFPTISF